MKNFIISVLLFVFGCNDKKQNERVSKTSQQKDSPKTNISIKVSGANEWIKYYKQVDSTFDFKKFKAENAVSLQLQETATPAKYESSFNNIYNGFLVYSPDKKQYIDFDSYNWMVNNDGNASFEADQEVILVNLETKSKNRIAFYGPSYKIEDAYWKNNDEAVLLGSSSDNVPFFTEFNFKENTLKNYQYPDTLNLKSEYQKMRLKKNGVATN